MQNKDHLFPFIVCFALLATRSAFAEQSFVLADALYVRSTPSRSAQALAIIPYGTTINHRSSPTESEGLHWVYIDALQGYAALEYLGKPQAVSSKSMNLKSFQSSKSCFLGPGWYEVSEIQLASDNFRYSHEFQNGGEVIHTQAYGHYTLTPVGIELHFFSSSRTSSIFPNPIQRSLNFTIHLQYEANINGFVIADDFVAPIPEFRFPVIDKSVLKAASEKSIDRTACRVLFLAAPCKVVPLPLMLKCLRRAISV